VVVIPTLDPDCPPLIPDAPADAIMVVIADQRIGAGRVIMPDMVRLYPLAPEAVPEGAAMDTSEVIGKIVREVALCGTPLIPDALANDEGDF
jgi:flagella basal body P-ring formation protein FlgA